MNRPIPSPSRRELLRTFAAGFGYTALAALAHEARSAETRAADKPHFAPRAKRVVFLFMSGAPSHVDMFDYKPELSKRNGEEVSYGRAQSKLLGSPWKFAQHGRSGLWMSELLPHLSRQADDLCMLHGMNTTNASHNGGVPLMHTGSFQNVRPSLGAWTVYGLGTENRELPGFIAMNPLSNLGQHNHGCAFLPAATQATLLRNTNDPSRPTLANIAPLRQSADEQRTQIDLVQALNRLRLSRDQVNPELEGVIHSYELAFQMQSSIPALADIGSESAATQRAYGIGGKATDAFGRQCLLARRFLEAGVRFVEIGTDGWDHHSSLQSRLSASCQAVDQPIAALLADLKQRDLLRDTLVVWGGEFGRTPHGQLNGGRDHNIGGFTMWLAGGGVKPGYVHGATDDLGVAAVDGKMNVHDLHATILHLLGLDHEKLTYRYSGREFRLTEQKGRVASEIFA